MRTLAVLKVNRKYLTDLRSVSISLLTFKMSSHYLVLAVKSSPGKFRSIERERLTLYTSAILARDLLPFSIERAQVLVWSVLENPKLKWLIQLRWQGMLP